MDVQYENQIAQNIIAAVLGDKANIAIEVKFSDNLYSDALTICENPQYCDFLRSRSPLEISNCNSLNGMYLMPKDIFSTQFILISNLQKKDGYSYISTVAHETQHAINHTGFCQKYCSNNFASIGSHRFNVSFQIWDEFAARRTGHRIFTAITMQKILNYSKDDVIIELRDNQREARLDEINRLLQHPNSVEQYKSIAAILAMFDVWSADYGISLSGLNDWCIEFYQALCIYPSIQEVNFDRLDSIIRSLWDRR